MKRIILITLIMVGITKLLVAQSVGIGTTTPDASAMLDITSATKGILFPRMTAAQRIVIPSPAAGLQVYQTDGTKGIYYFDGSIWSLIGAGGGASGWSMTGNAATNPATNFIGTTDDQPFVGKVNNEQIFRFAPNSNTTVLGYQANHADYTGGVFNHVIGYKAGYNNVGSFGHFDGLQAGYNNSGNNNQFIGYNAGYTNTTGNTNLFIGSASGYSNTTGYNNQFTGYQAGYKNTTAIYNFFNGTQAGFNNTIGNYNFFEGFNAGKANVSGQNNHFVGLQAGFSNTTANWNHFNGYQAGYSNTTGYGNHFDGFQAGYYNTTGLCNFFNGHKAGFSNTTGYYNHFSGFNAGNTNTTGAGNHFEGWQSGYNNTTGGNNFFIGFQAGFNNTTGDENYFNGFQAGYYNNTGFGNHFEGYQAGKSNLNGTNNYFSGNQAGLYNTSGHFNCYVGNQAGLQSVGSYNVFIGNAAGLLETGSNKLYIDCSSTSNPLIYGEFDTNLFKVNGSVQIKKGSPNSEPLLMLTESNATYARIKFRKTNAGGSWDQCAFVDPSYQNSCQMNFFANEYEAMSLTGEGNMFIWGDLYEYSDSTLKENIKPLQNSLASIQNINAVSYYWKDKKRKSPNREIGLLAQEVEKSFPELVRTDVKGEKSISYTHMVPVLLAAIKEQQVEIAALKAKQSEMDDMKVRMAQMEVMMASLLKGKE